MKLITTLLSMSAAGLILSALLYVLGRLFFRKLSPSLYYYAWLIVLLRFLLPIPGFILPAETEASAPAAVIRQEEAELRTPRGIVNGFWTGGQGYAGAPEAESPAYPQDPVLSESTDEAAESADFRRMLTELGKIFKEPALYISAWVFGFAVYMLNAVLNTLRFRTLLFGELKCAEPWEYELLKSLCPGRSPALYRSKTLSSPILIGLFSPRLILPEKSSSCETLENILRHELTHYRRRDLLYKHITLLVSALHWFNPFMPLIRREIERSCELSCDEKVLEDMDAERRKSYGETLLRCAADNALPARLAVSSFSVQKRQLKERLEQVLKFKKKSPAAIIASVLIIALLCGCGAAVGPARSSTEDVSSPPPTPEPAFATVTGIEDMPQSETVDGQEVYSVDSVAEFLAAIGPDRTISMAEGSYVLSMAKDYGTGSSDYYYWRESYDGYELVIKGVTNLSIVSESPSSANDPAVLILTEPRFANLLYFDNCAGISISGLSVGHLEGGVCSGGVLYMNACDDMAVYDSKLFGCGTIALQCWDCDGVLVENCLLTDCSVAALSAQYSRAVVISSCDINLNGAMPALFSFSGCEESIITDCDISENSGQTLLQAEGIRSISLLSSQVRENGFTCLFSVSASNTITVDGCEFKDYPASQSWLATADTVVDSEGKLLSEDDLSSMKYADIPWEMPGEKIVDYAQGEVHVSTVDELLAAIASNVTIYLEEGNYDLSTASEYGGYGNDYFIWEERFDGPSLIIFNCDNLSIIGAGKDKTNIYARPRYADIFQFNNCNDLALSGFTAGHVEEPGYCSGDVIKIQHSDNVKMEDLGLFGCGYIGINAYECKNMSIKACDIYECTGSGLIIGNCEGLEMSGCTVRDIAGGGMYLSSCTDAKISDSVFSNLAKDYADCASFISATGSSNIELTGCSFTDGGKNSCVVFDNCKSVEVSSCTSDIPGWEFLACGESGVHVDGSHIENCNEHH